jgi:Protein of unknown function (DUF3455)
MRTIFRRANLAATRHRRFFAVALLGCAIGMLNHASAESTYSPKTPTLITPPEGNAAFLVGHAKGTQGYVCLPKNGGASWTVNGARPEATLFTRLFGIDFQIITHFLSPDEQPNDVAPKPVPFGSATWQSSLDSSKVWAQVFNNNGVLATLPALTPVARMRVPSHACCSSRSALSTGRAAASSCLRSPSFSA